MNKKIFVWVIFTFVQMIFAAENKDSFMVPTLSNDEIVLRLVACNYLKNHAEITSFAGTNKAYHNYALSLAPARKNFLRAGVNGELLGSIWHKYGSIYCQAYRQEKLNDLILAYCTLREGLASGRNHHFSCFIVPLPYKQAPFFNDTGELSFYGYGQIEVNLSAGPFQMSTIIRYTTRKDHYNDEKLRCLMAKKGDEVGGTQMYRRFDFCMEYPSLLRAILKSSLVTINEDNQELIFWLDGVTMPDNYMEKIPMPEFSHNWVHNDYEHLPDIIKKFIYF